MREYPAGDDALLLDFSGQDSPARAAARAAEALRAATADGRLVVADVVAGAETVLVEALPGVGVNELGVRRVVHDLVADRSSGRAADSNSAGPLLVHTVYDGPDLEAAASMAGCSPDELVRAHTAVLWRVQFMGFAPGFGYLVPDDSSDKSDTDLLAEIRRRSQSRPAVPAGSVAVAAGYSAVYPRDSPGGWHLLGRTNRRMWDSSAVPPAVLAAGSTVRFERADR
ncbi:allophanate hydrolase subunit 1 [Gordonia sp. HY002]|uniref:5-oxoprolinase subunit B family protein n=1 Tax=Gordonia zhenghanii TaxID=2911516 RepID=UPI001EF11020|nr:carboxyltransferase domain-containing protein [Gordonia zhenghanii]MCF8568854.1 allophanate hydrolase subunit 1 [Gordonia zhenghanii]MCF8602276.1 allophanate hydrolase subunit 1 [Gordonia zhenghanii]